MGKKFFVGMLLSCVVASCTAENNPFKKRPDGGAKLTEASVQENSGESAKPNANGNNPLGEGITVAEATNVTNAQVAEAKAKTSGGKKIGATTATLGLLDRGGFWLETPLVKKQTEGRVVWPKTGASANVTLVPLDIEKTAGSNISLAAMQLMGIPLTEFAQLEVFAN